MNNITIEVDGDFIEIEIERVSGDRASILFHISEDHRAAELISKLLKRGFTLTDNPHIEQKTRKIVSEILEALGFLEIAKALTV